MTLLERIYLELLAIKLYEHDRQGAGARIDWSRITQDEKDGYRSSALTMVSRSVQA